MSRNIRPNRGAGAHQQHAPARYEEYEDDYPSSSRYLSRDREPAPPPSSRSAAVLGRSDVGGRYGQTLSTGSTASTTSSSGSSLLDRMKIRSYESSRTSLEDDRDTPRQNAPTWARKPGALKTQIREEREPAPRSPANDPSSAGNTLWGRVVNAAGSLTINVSKAWENSGDGPETPPGGETRLTKAMKEYYIQRARGPQDLPHWLFEEHERMPLARPPPRDTRNDGRRGRYEEEYEEEQVSAPAPRGGALRDIYDRAASSHSTNSRTTPLSNRSTPTSHGYESSPAATGESKATSRLRALRDAKRMQGAAAASGVRSNRYDEEYDDGGRRSMEPASDSERRMPARTGLPSRPGGRY